MTPKYQQAGQDIGRYLDEKHAMGLIAQSNLIPAPDETNPHVLGITLLLGAYRKVVRPELERLSKEYGLSMKETYYKGYTDPPTSWTTPLYRTDAFPDSFEVVIGVALAPVRGAKEREHDS
jgi:hypothetical protein